MSDFTRNTNHSLRNTLRYGVAAAALCCVASGVLPVALARDGAFDPDNYAWQAGAFRHTDPMGAFRDNDRGPQSTPPVIPEFAFDFDPSGAIATAQPEGPTNTSRNAFFADIG